MLREIIAMWKGESFMGKVVEEFGQMLSAAEYVFSNSWKAFVCELDVENIKKSIYDKDSSVNKHERDIRRKLVEHLSINPRQDVSACLTMMSLIKDAERIGDYSKNIFGVVILFKCEYKDMKYIDRLSALQQRISNHLSQLRSAFINSDENMAKVILIDYYSIKDECNSILQDLFSDTLSTRESATTALLSRYLKRINSHISNIASGIIYPMDKIDFVRGDLLE